MRRCLWLWCWNQDAIVAVDGEKGFSTKKTRMSREKIRLVMDEFFDWKAIVHHEICSTWSDGKQTIIPRNVSASEGCCVQEVAWIVGNPHFDVAPRQYAGSRVACHPHLSRKTSDIRCVLTTLLSALIPNRLFLFPNFETTLKGSLSQTIQEIH